MLVYCVACYSASLIASTVVDLILLLIDFYEDDDDDDVEVRRYEPREWNTCVRQNIYFIDTQYTEENVWSSSFATSTHIKCYTNKACCVWRIRGKNETNKRHIYFTLDLCVLTDVCVNNWKGHKYIYAAASDLFFVVVCCSGWCAIDASAATWNPRRKYDGGSCVARFSSLFSTLFHKQKRCEERERESARCSFASTIHSVHMESCWHDERFKRSEPS